MTAMNIVCFGFGQVAKNFIQKMYNDGASFNLTTTSRDVVVNLKGTPWSFSFLIKFFAT